MHRPPEYCNPASTTLACESVQTTSQQRRYTGGGMALPAGGGGQSTVSFCVFNSLIVIVGFKV